MIQFDYSKLNGKIKEKFKTQDAFAEALNISRASLSMKLNNKSEFDQYEMKKSCELLGIPLEEMNIYFFTPEVQQKEQKKGE